MGKLAVLALIAGCYSSAAPPAQAPKPVDPSTRHARTAADPLGFLPAEAELVAHLDAASLRRSPLWARVEESLMAKAGPTLEQFKLACGFDPIPHIERMAIGLRHLGTPELEGVVVIGGLSRTQLMSCMTRVVRSMPQLARIERDVVLVRADANARPVAFTFADARTLVILTGARAASAQSLRDLLDGGTPLRGSEAFMEMFRRVDERSHGWFFMSGAAKMFEGLAALGFHPRAVFGTVELPGGAAAKLYARMPTVAEATSLVSMIQGQIAALQALVERFEVTSDDLDVVIDVALTEEQISLGASLLGP